MHDALHHVSAGAAYPHCHAMSSEHLSQLGWEGTLVALLLSCSLLVQCIWCDCLKCTLTSAATASVTVAAAAAAAAGTEGLGGPPGALRAEP
jgi:hypothetical protein